MAQISLMSKSVPLTTTALTYDHHSGSHLGGLLPSSKDARHRCTLLPELIQFQKALRIHSLSYTRLSVFYSPIRLQAY